MLMLLSIQLRLQRFTTNVAETKDFGLIQKIETILSTIFKSKYKLFFTNYH